MGSSPGWGTKILQAIWQDQKKKKKKKSVMKKHKMLGEEEWHKNFMAGDLGRSRKWHT